MRNIIITLLVSLAVLSADVYSQTETETKKTETTVTAAETTTQDSKVTVFFYRYNQFVGWALQPPIFCDDFRVAKIENGRFFTVRIDPGKHTFHSDEKQSGMEIDLKTGEVYYIRVDLASGIWYGHGRLQLVQKEQGGYEVKKLKPMDAKKVKDPPPAKTEKPSN
jgi:hypothetical protein